MHLFIAYFTTLSFTLYCSALFRLRYTALFHNSLQFGYDKLISILTETPFSVYKFPHRDL